MTDDPFDNVVPIGAAKGGQKDRKKSQKTTRKGIPRGPADAENLPNGFPVVPLGHADGIFRFLSARGEMVALSASSLAKRAEQVALFGGAEHALDWLAWISKPKARSQDKGFNAAGVADFLVAASAALPLFDSTVQIRRRGTWRGPDGQAVAHCGDIVVGIGDDHRHAGQFIGGAVYVAAARGPRPGAKSAPAEDIRSLRDGFAEAYAWARSTDADVLMGWIGQALLGAFPTWRSHMWFEGPSGSGKTTLVELVNALLGGMSAGIRNGSSEAALRQATNEMALVRVFDEAEGGDDRGHVENIINLFRNMSGPEGAKVERAGVGAGTFRLYGAGFFASVLPGAMQQQDRNRFIMLRAAPRPPAEDPEAEAAQLVDMQEAAAFYGPILWRRMLSEAHRFDKAHRRYSALVQALGGDRRAGDTIGVTLAGWDLLLFDGPTDDDRLERARPIALSLLADVEENANMGEGERCLMHLMGSYVAKDHGGSIPVAELVSALQASADDFVESDVRLLGRMGMRVLDGPRHGRDLFVVGAAHPQLERALAGSQWKAGGHRSALLMLDGAERAAPTRVAGSKVRGVRIPARHLPGYRE
jgi:hypothetical protein